jgi:hypothetical protein
MVVRGSVAGNLNTPVDVLVKLADDTETYVINDLVGNPKLPREILFKLADSDDKYNRLGVATNESTPPELLSKLANDEESSVKEQVAKNPRTPIEALLKLANDKDFYVHSKAKRHPTYLAYMKEQGMNESLFDSRTIYNEDNTMKLTKTELLRLVEEVVEESHTKADEEKLKKISKQLKKSVKMHGDQSDAIDDIVDRSDDEELNEKIERMIKEEYKALLDEKKKKPCKPAKGKRFAKRVNGKCRSYGQAGQAKGGGDRIRPGTKKGDAYCARSAKIKKCKNPPCANDLSRKKWKCRGSKSMK